MMKTVETRKTLAQLRDDLPKAAAAHRFGVLSVLDLKEKLREKGVEYAGQVLIFEVCNPLKAKAVLEAAPEVSAVLPCRISAYTGKDGRSRLSTVLPTALIGAVGVPSLEPVAREVEETLAAILEEAAR